MDAVAGEEPAGQPALVEPVRAVVAEQEGSLGCDVGCEARRAANRYLVPRARRGPAGCRVDQVMLLLAAAEPAPLRAAARSETAGDEPHRSAIRQRHVEWRVRGQVAARRDEAGVGEEAQRVVHGGRLDDAVQVKPPAEDEHAAVERDRAGTRGLRWLVARRQLGEVAVVARAFQGGAESRVDQAGGGVPSAQRGLDHSREQRRHKRGARRRIDAAELAVGPEAAEDRIALLEQRLHPRGLGGRGALDDDLATHGLEDHGPRMQAVP